MVHWYISGFRELVFKNNSRILHRSSLRNKLFSSDGISHLVIVLLHGVLLTCFCFGCKLREEWRPVNLGFSVVVSLLATVSAIWCTAL